MNRPDGYKIFPRILSFYLPDFLWACALCSGLFAVYPLRARVGWIWGAVTLLYGVGWELLQWCAVISGTADTVDVFLYLAAAIVVVAINYKMEKRKDL